MVYVTSMWWHLLCCIMWCACLKCVAYIWHECLITSPNISTSTSSSKTGGFIPMLIHSSIFKVCHPLPSLLPVCSYFRSCIICNQSIHRFNCPPPKLPVYPPKYPSSIHPSTHLSIYLSIFSPICLFVCPSVYPSICSLQNCSRS